MSEQYDSPNQAAQSADEAVPLQNKTRKVAHRLNNVLGIIQGNVEMLEATEANLSQKSKLRLEKINVAISEATNLVSGIYEFEAEMEGLKQELAQQTSPGSVSSGD